MFIEARMNIAGRCNIPIIWIFIDLAGIFSAIAHILMISMLLNLARIFLDISIFRACDDRYD